MMSNTVIKVENLSKQYRLGQVGTGTIRDDLGRFWAKVRGKEDPTLKIGATNTLTTQQINNKQLNEKQSDYVWALRDINFEVEQGEVLGIIGKNGAGKSTLLKILSKVTTPTIGNIKVKGRIASLLEVGTGFHPELSGRENIFLNGAILGMTKAEIRNKFDEIVDFAGVERYIDTPVKRYSSGMYVRLAFAVAAHLEPEILIVDEVLAVGDAEFQKKALGKMQDVSKTEGRTVLFVSHNMAAVKQLCTRGILLINGTLGSIGSISNIISSYLVVDSQNNAEWIRKDHSSSDIFFNRISILNSKGKITNTITTREAFSIQIMLTVLKKIKDATISIRFSNQENIPILTTSLFDNIDNLDVLDIGTFTININISKNILVAGKYNLVFACFISRMTLYDIVENNISLNILELEVNKKDLDRQGFILPDYKWEIIKME